MRVFFLPVLLLLLLCSSCQNRQRAEAESQNGELRGTISISGAFALYPLTVVWAEEFKKLHPGVRIDISAGGAGKGMTDALSKLVDIGLVSRAIHDEEIKKGAWYVPVAKDAVIPVISLAHPQKSDLLSRGVRKSDFEKIFITGQIKNWSQVGSLKSSLPVHAYTRSDAAGAAESWAAYFGKKQEDLLGVGVFGDPGVSQAVMKDAAGIGYNNIVYAYDLKTKLPLPGAVPLPIDLNENSVVDADENFYGRLDSLMQAIADGRFPSPPARELYFVTGGKPQRKVVKEFIQWVLTEGQKFAASTGYVNLPQEMVDSEKAKLQ